MTDSTDLPESWHQKLQRPFLAGMGALGLASQAKEMQKTSRHSDACHQKLFGGELPEAEEMIVNTGTIEIRQEAPEKKKSRFGTAAKLAMGAGLMASGAGGLAGVMMLLDGGKEVVTEIEERTNDRVPTYGFGEAE